MVLSNCPKRGYSQGQANHTLFTKFSPNGKIVILIVYGDDITVTGDYTKKWRSSAKAEYRALAQSICEGIWLKRLLDELKIPTKEPMTVFCNNLVAINIAKNLVHHDRTQHVELDHHLIKEK
ncbi:Retrovirus-related Pol polyprotein from transposon RE1 [Vitis vinifera]|uniref:Retrovirus-related Pol polyprotein from transposon RE1 n=1 Tax=Vitis vinifera TaxID=29760 RepID=A0A438I9Z9_VITVI|nr:Retrovirus-related Pol polyprotein from transposon RE1 [Vitis vinifera]